MQQYSLIGVSARLCIGWPGGPVSRVIYNMNSLSTPYWLHCSVVMTTDRPYLMLYKPLWVVNIYITSTWCYSTAYHCTKVTKVVHPFHPYDLSLFSSEWAAIKLSVTRIKRGDNVTMLKICSHLSFPSSMGQAFSRSGPQQHYLLFQKDLIDLMRLMSVLFYVTNVDEGPFCGLSNDRWVVTPLRWHRNCAFVCYWRYDSF